MRWIAHIAVTIGINALALIASAHFVPGFFLSGTFPEILFIGLTLTVLNVLLRPILKLILGPIILLTFGLGIIVVNALVLWMLDLLSKNLIIEGIPSLVTAGIVVGFLNFIHHLADHHRHGA